ncbi:MAG: glycosyltransferase [Gammaproteobacteria bacterium]|nr:glycosyltransferase [Gammaproteobacteria bacterium]
MTGGGGSSEIRVAHIITGLEIGGAERMLIKVAAALAPRIQQLIIAMSGVPKGCGPLADHGVEVITLGMPRGKLSVAGFYRALKVLRHFRPTIIQSWLYHADLLGSALVYCCGRPKIVWNIRCTDMNLEKYSLTTQIVRRALVALSGVPSAIVSNSHAGISIHEKLGYRAREWVLIGNGFDIDKFSPNANRRREFRTRLGVPEFLRIVGLVARRDPMKDHETLLAAAKIVLMQRDDVMFYLCGAGIPQLRKEVARLEMSDQFMLEDVQVNVEGIYPGLDFFALSSAFGEGFPNVLGEAMSSGVPCITTDVGDAGLVVADTGILVPRRAPEALAAAILCGLAWEPDEYKRRASAARNRITANYSLGIITRQYEELYRRLAGVPAG